MNFPELVYPLILSDKGKGGVAVGLWGQNQAEYWACSCILILIVGPVRPAWWGPVRDE